MAVKKETSKATENLTKTATAVKANPNEHKTCSESSCTETKAKPNTASRPSAAPVKGNNASARVTIKYDVGFGNNLFIRGDGAGLNWEKGVQLKNHSNNEWVWETTAAFAKCEFKILINDKVYETGPNHQLTFGSTVQYAPHFPNQ